MRNNIEKPENNQIPSNEGGVENNYSFNPADIQEFFKQAELIGIRREDFDFTFEEIGRMVTVGTPDELPCRELKKLLIFLNEMSMLFKSVDLN